MGRTRATKALVSYRKDYLYRRVTIEVLYTFTNLIAVAAQKREYKWWVTFGLKKMKSNYSKEEKWM